MADKAKRAALIGYDCLIPKRLEAMLAQGGLEHFPRLHERRQLHPRSYNLPTVTPPSWATICTGAIPARTAWRTITTTMKPQPRLQGNHAGVRLRHRDRRNHLGRVGQERQEVHRGQLPHVVAFPHEERRHDHGSGPLARRNPLAPARQRTQGIPRFRKRDLHGILPMGVQGPSTTPRAGRTCPSAMNRSKWS